jgi:hypothetical protein
MIMVIHVSTIITMNVIIVKLGFGGREPEALLYAHQVATEQPIGMNDEKEEDDNKEPPVTI